MPDVPGRSNPSGTTIPAWYDSAAIPDFPPLTAATRADVCVVGAGIAGLTTAYFLARAGKRVIVLDEKPVAGGETGRTSAHLASALDDRFSALERRLGVERTRQHYESHAAAIDAIERIARDHNIDCDFARLDGLLFRDDDAHGPDLDKELEAAQRAGVPGVQLLAKPSFRGAPPRPCISFPRQGRFHPLRYIVGLTRTLQEMGVRIHTGARVRDLAGDGPVVAELDSGVKVTADFGIAATNIPTPINNWVGIYTKVAPYRTYMIALEMRQAAIPDALYWDTADPYHYVRVHHANDRSLLLVGGEDHKTGQPENLDGPARFHRLETWARRWFDGLGAVTHRWSGQVSEPDDGVAFIGRVPTANHKACFVITGDSGMGLTHSTLGGMLIADLILGNHNPWQDLYDPARKPWTAAGEFIKQNVNAVAQMTDYLKPAEVDSPNEIAPGHGAVVRQGLKRLAVYREPSGALHTCSAICPHLKCVVRWNDTEHSWDCPCHGSRFDAHGKLIMGPAIDDLERAD